MCRWRSCPTHCPLQIKWTVPNECIDNIRGLERNFNIAVEYHKPLRLGRFSIKLPLSQVRPQVTDGVRARPPACQRDCVTAPPHHLQRLQL